MPVYLRKFYLNKLIDVKKEEKKQMKKATKKTGKVSGPNIPSGFKR